MDINTDKINEMLNDLKQLKHSYGKIKDIVTD